MQRLISLQVLHFAKSWWTGWVLAHQLHGFSFCKLNAASDILGSLNVSESIACEIVGTLFSS